MNSKATTRTKALALFLLVSLIAAVAALGAPLAVAKEKDSPKSSATYVDGTNCTVEQAAKNEQEAKKKDDEAAKLETEAAKKESQGKSKEAAQLQEKAAAKRQEAAELRAECAVPDGPVSGGAVSSSSSPSSSSPGKQLGTKSPSKKSKSGSAAATSVPGATATSTTSVLSSVASAVTSAASIVVDGNLDSIYGAFSSLPYTRDQGGVFTGRISVIESADAYYIGFQQALGAKSNSYCENRRSTAGCYQEFRSLVGSDYISFQWTIGGMTIFVPVDIISANGSAPSGYAGVVGGGDGGSLIGISPSAVQGKSAMDYNLNVLGWRDFVNSPNFAGQPDYPYIYPSIAEVRVSKSGLPLGHNLASMLAPEVVVHNSPAAPTAEQPRQFISLECPGGQLNGVVGTPLTFSVVTSQDGLPLAGANVLALLSGTGQIISVGGISGDRGATGTDGAAAIVVTSAAAGQGSLRAVWDLDNDGVWDQATEPVTEPVCPFVWGTSSVSYEFSITKVVDKAEAQRGDVLTYEVKVTNTGAGTLTGLVITDAIPLGTTYVPLSASSSGVFDAVANALTWQFATLGVGDSVTVTFKVTINADAPSRIPNVAIARTNEVGPKQAEAVTKIPEVLGVKILPKTGLDTVTTLMLTLGLMLMGAGFLALAPKPAKNLKT